ncbi:MAG: glutamine amidotransferase [Phycisphaeraceae bacterium]
MPDPAPILYLGDTLLHEAASYLAGVMHHAGLSFDYVQSDRSALDALKAGPRELIILSDYPAHALEPEGHDQVARLHDAGAGLLMIGGWESYHGVGGDWDTSLVADRLPVVISDDDDRINHDQPALLRRVNEHPILADLPWDQRPPAVGGYSRFTAKQGATTLIEVVRQRVVREGETFKVTNAVADPMLVVSENGNARTACLATDAAPHWVGPLVDWGTEPNDPTTRVPCQAPAAPPVEVGQHYARFFTQLVTWCMGN